MTAQNQEKNSILIFDANIFLIGTDFNVIPQKIYTVPKILKEIEVEKYLSRNRNIINRINIAIESGNLIIKEPSPEYLSKVIDSSYKTGDLKALSEADQQLIALALQLKDLTKQEVILYSNDYSVQNCCKELKVHTKSLMKKGITQLIHFEVYCPQCKTLHDANELNEHCEICGSKLKRRPILK
ncbi:MAG: hypothetical protein EU532_06085 [Promethearchaeota archaeon]|nr:MAG: hypothetical protein EU532_06085 [Candidatus Lokiarchaeota archaeon]